MLLQLNKKLKWHSAEKFSKCLEKNIKSVCFKSLDKSLVFQSLDLISFCFVNFLDLVTVDLKMQKQFDNFVTGDCILKLEENLMIQEHK